MPDYNRTTAIRRPTAIPDGTNGINSRADEYGEGMVVPVLPERYALAKEGSYYTFTNPTIDTGVGYGVMAAYAVTTPAFHVANTAPTGGRTIYLDYLHLRPTVAPASATNWKIVIDVDTSTRLTSISGGASRPVNNVNPFFPINDFEGLVYAFTAGTVITVAAAQSVRTIYHFTLAQAIPVVQDEYLITFGTGFEMGLAHTATITKKYASCPPVVIPPGCSASIHMYGASNAITGMSAEYDGGLVQR